MSWLCVKIQGALTMKNPPKTENSLNLTPSRPQTQKKKNLGPVDHTQTKHTPKRAKHHKLAHNTQPNRYLGPETSFHSLMTYCHEDCKT